MAKANPFRFSTKYQDDESDLLYYGYRYYKASTGTWLSRDPSEEDGGLNVYAFSANNSVCFVDSLGLAKLRFEVVTGVYNVLTGSGEWSQPFWAGSGNYGINSISAWSEVSLNNAYSVWEHTHYSPDYCNTVQLSGVALGTKGDAGTIKVYAEDDCGGDFTVFGFYFASLSGSGPSGINSGYGYANLHDAYGNLLSKATIKPSSPNATPNALIFETVTLQPKTERLVAEYIPILALKNRDTAGGVPAYVTMFGYITMAIF